MHLGVNFYLAFVQAIEYSFFQIYLYLVHELVGMMSCHKSFL